MARNVADVALELSVTAGADGFDTFAPPVPVPNYMDLDVPLAGIKVGWSSTMNLPTDPEVQNVVRQAAKALEDAGMDVEETEIPAMAENDAGFISTVTYLTEGKQALLPIVKGREGDLTSLLRTRYIESPDQKFVDYLDANLKWDALKQGVGEWFTRYHLFLCPTVPMTAYPHQQRGFNLEGEEMPSRHALRATMPWDLTGSPAMSVPFGMSSDNLPIGVQLVGRHFDELTVLRAAKALEDSFGEYRRPPVG
jgi:aspartyl-tRNA(Asn)/glutamyl-tRNA(Gln) amidotransferase subunit A